MVQRFILVAHDVHGECESLYFDGEDWSPNRGEAVELLSSDPVGYRKSMVEEVGISGFNLSVLYL